MSNFIALWDKHHASWEYCAAAQRLNATARDTVDAFLDTHGFTELTFVRASDQALLFTDAKNPGLTFRLAPLQEKRAVIPHVVQPLHSETISQSLKLELLPTLEQVQATTFNTLRSSFISDVRSSGYFLADNNAPVRDIGVFHYPDPRQPGKFNHAMMGVEASAVFAEDGAVTPPTCSANYPALEVQWQAQCALTESDPRLSALLGGLPKKLAGTTISPRTVRTP